MYGEGLSQTENKAGKCRTFQRNAGRIAIDHPGFAPESADFRI